MALDQCHGAGTCDPNTGACTNPAKVDGTACADDSNPCTTDACTGGSCAHAPVAVGTSCSDGNACNGNETCSAAGRCQAGTPVTCLAQDQCHTVGTCDSGTGACSNPVRSDGTACNDGSACTQTDQCVAGVCTGSNAVICTAADACHTAGACNPDTGACSNPAQPDGTACSDGNACTQLDQCVAGVCTGGNPVACVAQGACHGVGTCDPSTGACSNPVLADGTACTAGNACSTNDACQSGVCQPGAPVATDDGDPCTLDTCDPIQGVQHRACSAIDRTVATQVSSATSFLYSGNNPLQTGVASGTIRALTAAVLRGRVLTRTGAGLPGVTVTVAGHAEYGSTISQGDGGFDLAVNGGSAVRLDFQLNGYLAAQRTVQAPWQDYAVVPDVVLIRPDSQVTAVDLTSSDTQVALSTDRIGWCDPSLLGQL